MFEHVIVIFYNFAVFCGICNLSLTGLLIYKQRKKALERLFAFLLAFFVYGFLNMLIYYDLHVLMGSSIMPYYAMIITVFYTLMNFLWVDFLIEAAGMKGKNTRRCLYIICGVCIILWVMDSLIFMDGKLNVINKAGNEITTLVECAVVIVMAAFCARIICKNRMHFYHIIETLLVMAFFIYITVKDIRISFFNYNIENYSLSSWSFCAFFSFLTNVMTLIYLVGIFKRFIQEAHHDKEEINYVEMTLEELKERYGISAREQDVLILIYRGKNNAEIAEELFISANTVKKHINSIFRKLQVTSRAEVISKIRLKNF